MGTEGKPGVNHQPQLFYTDNEAVYIPVIDRAYNLTSKALLNFFFETLGIKKRFAAFRSLFFLEKSDWLTHFLTNVGPQELEAPYHQVLGRIYETCFDFIETFSRSLSSSNTLSVSSGTRVVISSWNFPFTQVCCRSFRRLFFQEFVPFSIWDFLKMWWFPEISSPRTSIYSIAGASGFQVWKSVPTLGVESG